MPDKARKKLFHNVGLVSMGVKDDRIFKKLTESGIWEFRAEYESNEYRLLSFWDKTRSSIVVATHGFDKKTRKTPKQEIMENFHQKLIMSFLIFCIQNMKCGLSKNARAASHGLAAEISIISHISHFCQEQIYTNLIFIFPIILIIITYCKIIKNFI